jgi:hypothetical protein
VVKVCYITAGIGDDNIVGSIGFPYAMISVGTAVADDQNPLLLRHQFQIGLGVSVPGDMVGQRSLVGGVRVAAGPEGYFGTSQGKGLLEVEEEVLKVVARTGDDGGIRIRCTNRGGATAAVVQDATYIAERTYTMECWSTVERYYHPPSNLSRNGTLLSWRKPPARYDNPKSEVLLVRKAGGSPPQSPDDGDIVVKTSAETYSDDGGGDGYSYAVFAAYDEATDNPEETWPRFSDLVSGAWV